MDDRDDLQAKLERALAKCAQLREENERLRILLAEHNVREPDVVRTSTFAPGPGRDQGSESVLSPDAKVHLFRSLFRGRDDVYAIRWTARDGRTGYSPARVHAWGSSKSPHGTAGTIADAELLPLTDAVIRGHLQGHHTVGIYPLLRDETCRLLAVDFDKRCWKDDVTAFLETCDRFGVPAVLERSRSGNGGHVWIFFECAVAAALARKLGCALITETMERRHQLGLDSYDRVFPSQDTMPKGGFGNLIALPLQKEPRSDGNSVFLDASFEPVADQWQFLASTQRTSADRVQSIVREAEHGGRVVGVRSAPIGDEFDSTPWTAPPSGHRDDLPIAGPLPARVQAVRADLIYVEKDSLPSAMINRILRLASFQNPEFYRAQAMRLSTFGKPRIISCAEEFPVHVAVPRGCLKELQGLLGRHGIDLELADQRFDGEEISVRFAGVLRPEQRAAADAMVAHDDGILSAPTAFGKTAVAAWLIAERRVNTLILVHRRQLMDQWRERLASFLDISVDEIGQVGGGKDTRKGRIDVAVIQSLNRKGQVKDWIVEYGQVIADECHHLSAFTFEQVMRKVKARFIVGLSATPKRKDGHDPIIEMQCGPIRFVLSPKAAAAASPFEHVVVPRLTEFTAEPRSTDSGIQALYAALARDERRNAKIASDVLEAVESGRSPLVLTERTEQVRDLARLLSDRIPHVIELRGGLSAARREQVARQLDAVPADEPRVLIATGRYVGEGFDDARLDTLFLAMPISWRGTLQQYVGRLHRRYDSKRVVRVYDYVDMHVPVLYRMYEKRLRGYAAIGYSIETKA